jgi:ArsR family transcriptional regulator
MADIFDVVADATRRDILSILLTQYSTPVSGVTRHDPPEGTSVSEIVAALGLSQPTVSKHLKVLREAGLVSVREQGQHRYYRLESAPLEQVEDWVIPFLSTDCDESEESGSQGMREALTGESRALAGKIGKVVADTTFHVATVMGAVHPKHWRKGSEKP